MAIKVITDTSCDLPGQELDKYGIEMIPLKVTFANGETFLDRFELTPDVFVQKMAASKTLPKTSAPDPDTFLRYFKKGLEEKGTVLFVSLSSGLSSTLQTALLACRMLGSNRVKVFDSLGASLGVGIMAVRAVQMATRGASINMILEQLARLRSTRQVLFVLDTLENVVKGGRLTKFEGFAGNLLNIKPILTGNSRGIPEITEKVRGRRKALKRLLEMVEERGGTALKKKIVGISHVNCIQDALLLRDEIVRRFKPEQVMVADMSATIGTYAGEGAVMINF